MLGGFEEEHWPQMNGMNGIPEKKVTYELQSDWDHDDDWGFVDRGDSPEDVAKKYEDDYSKRHMSGPRPKYRIVRKTETTEIVKDLGSEGLSV